MMTWAHTDPGSVDHAPGVHQTKAVLMTVGKSGLVSCPQSFTLVHLYAPANKTSPDTVQIHTKVQSFPCGTHIAWYV